MRMLLLFAIGLVIGAFAAVTVANGLRRRDAYPRGVMNVMAHHLGELQASLRAGRCPAAETGHAFARLEAVSAEIDDAFPGLMRHDTQFRSYAGRLHEALAPAADAADCKTLAPQVTRVADACDACHRDYR